MAYVQDTFGWGLGFAIPTIIMVTSIALFSSGSRFYALKQTKGSSVAFKSFENMVHAMKATALKIVNVRFALLNKSDVVELE